MLTEKNIVFLSHGNAGMELTLSTGESQYRQAQGGVENIYLRIGLWKRIQHLHTCAFNWQINLLSVIEENNPFNKLLSRW